MQDTPIGTLLKKLREEKGLSQRKFAIKCGLDRGYISQIEAGKTTSMTLRIADKLAKGLDMSLAAFLDTISSDDEDIRAFLINEFPELEDEEKEWIRVAINMVRERKSEREKYQAKGE
jgi:transcriptional regulator with XRE-family HTH domain